MSVASPRILSLSLFLLLSLALSLDFRLVDRFPGTLGYKHRDAPRYKDLRALVAATCIAKHFRPRGSSRLRLPTSQWRGEGCTKGSKGKKGSLALDQLPYPSRSHLLSTCVVRTRLLAVETHPPTTSQLSVATLFSIRPPPSRQTIHDYALGKSSRLLLRTTIRFFVFNFVTRSEY